MKKIILVIFAISAIFTAEGQTVVKKTKAEAKPQSSVSGGVSMRRQLFDAYQNQPTAETRWQHVVYRELDLNNDANAALYYPQEEMNGMQNLFSVIFDAMYSGKLQAYEYLDGREVFSAKYVVSLKNVMATHEFDAQDVPSSQVLSYYIKEKWDFDKNTSQYRAQVVAICPVLHKIGDFGSSATRYPLFWIKMDDLRPFISTKPILNSGMNTAVRYTIDDFFTLPLYDGKLYKVENPRGLTLMQQYPDADTLEMKRAELDAQLKNFGKSIWIDRTAEAPAKEKVAKEKAVAEEVAAAASEVQEPTVAAEVQEPAAVAEVQEPIADKKARKNRRTKQAVSHSVRR